MKNDVNQKTAPRNSAVVLRNMGYLDYKTWWALVLQRCRFVNRDVTLGKPHKKKFNGVKSNDLGDQFTSP